jgi:hypothetical protein
MVMKLCLQKPLFETSFLLFNLVQFSNFDDRSQTQHLRQGIVSVARQLINYLYVHFCRMLCQDLERIAGTNVRDLTLEYLGADKLPRSSLYFEWLSEETNCL